MKKVIVDESKCIRCGACMQAAEDVFGYGSQGESVPLVDTVSDDNKSAIMAMEGCPTGAITLEDVIEVDGEVKKDGCTCPNCKCDPCECGDDCHCGECDCDDCDCAA